MDQETANNRYKEWGVVLLLDAPEQIELGIDNTSWTVGQKFKGIKLIPPGPHIVYYSLKSEKNMFKLSFFINITQEKRVHVKRWNTKFEDFLEVDEEELNRYTQGVNDFSLDKYLGAYPYDRFEVWSEVSQFIDQRVLDKLNPIEKKMHLQDQEYKNLQVEEQKQKMQNTKIANDLYGEEFSVDQNIETEKDLNDLEKNMQDKLNLDEQKQEQEEKLKYSEKQQQQFIDKCEQEDFNTIAGTIYYTEIPKKQMNHGLQGKELTDVSFDKSQIFKKLLKHNFEEDYKYFFGEFQYSFNSFLLGEHYESFEHWKDMFVLLTNCDQFMSENQQFGIDLIPVLYGMLKQFPKDFFIDNISQDNFTRKCLLYFLESCQTEKSKKLRERAKKLQAMLEDKFLFFPVQNIVEVKQGQYKFDIEDEDAPQIVDLNEQFISF